jgi:hypothetical protein
MAFPPARVKQSTSTTGTGTLTLNAASSEVRSFQAGFGSGTIQVRYILSRTGVYEIGYGTLDTAAGTLTRDAVVSSSNADALVSLAAGTTDLFFDFLPGDRQIRSVSANTTLTRADLGVLICCTQSSDITITLPAVATVPGQANGLSMGYMIRNSGTNNSVVWIDPNGSETLEGSAQPFPLFGGESMEILSIGTAWVSERKPTGLRVVGRTSASSSSSVDFVLPQYISAARSRYRLDFRQVQAATDGATLLMRTDDAGGASFDAGGTDYLNSIGTVSGASSWAAVEGTASGVQLSTDMDTGVAAHCLTGFVEINPGAAGARYPMVVGESISRGNGASYAGWQRLVIGGVRGAAYDCNAIRLIFSSGNISLGDFVLSAAYD